MGAVIEYSNRIALKINEGCGALKNSKIILDNFS